MELQTITLFDKPLFTLMKTREQLHFPASMPENEAAFVYILEGHCTNFSELENFNLKKGQAVLAKSGDGIFKTHLFEGTAEFALVSIRFHRDILEKLYQNSPSPFFKNSNIPLTVNSVTVQPHILIRQYIENLVTYFKYKREISDDLLVLKLKELIALLLQTPNAPKVIEIMRNLFEEKTFEFKEIIKAHILSPISISELAQLTNRSLSAFKKKFKETFQDTPANYIINQRIQKVAELLPQSDESLSNIAYDCQFKSLAHMSRVFKAKYGISPSTFRNNRSIKR